MTFNYILFPFYFIVLWIKMLVFIYFYSAMMTVTMVTVRNPRTNLSIAQSILNLYSLWTPYTPLKLWTYPGLVEIKLCNTTKLCCKVLVLNYSHFYQQYIIITLHALQNVTIMMYYGTNGVNSKLNLAVTCFVDFTSFYGWVLDRFIVWGVLEVHRQGSSQPFPSAGASSRQASHFSDFPYFCGWFVNISSHPP